MKKKLGARSGRDFWRQVAGSQRMCGIHPYRMRSEIRDKRLEKRNSDPQSPISNLIFRKDPGIVIQRFVLP